jgi:hypothetical protein
MNARSPSFRGLSCSRLPYNWVWSRPISVDSAPMRARLRHARRPLLPRSHDGDSDGRNDVRYTQKTRENCSNAPFRLDQLESRRTWRSRLGCRSACAAFYGCVEHHHRGNTSIRGLVCGVSSAPHPQELPTPVFARGGSNGRGR